MLVMARQSAEAIKPTYDQRFAVSGWNKFGTVFGKMTGGIEQWKLSGENLNLKAEPDAYC
jgi:hypothetical protein